MADIPIRWAVIRHICEVLAGHELLGGVQVEPGYPGELATQGPELIWVDAPPPSTTLIPVGTGGRKVIDDTFTVPLQVRVAGRTSLTELGDRLDEVVGAVIEVMATDPSLDGFDGVLSAEVTSIAGPAIGLTADGRVGFARIVVSVHTRIGP